MGHGRRFFSSSTVTICLTVMATGAGIAAINGQVGASAGDLVPAPPTISSSPPRVSDASALTYPMDRYELSPDDQLLMSRATIVLASACENRFGVANSNSGNITTVPIDNSRHYGIASLAEAQVLGYHAPAAADPSSSSNDKGASSAWTPSPLEELTAYGTGPGADALKDRDGNPLPNGGCYTQAWSQLVGPNPLDPEVANSRSHDASTFAENDERVQVAWRAWSECMAGFGLKFSSPWQANDAGWKMDEPPTTDELRTATSDAHCRDKTNLVGIWYAVESGYKNEIISMNSQEFTKLDAQLVGERMRAVQALTH